MLIGCGGSCFYNEFDFFFFLKGLLSGSVVKNKKTKTKKKKNLTCNLGDTGVTGCFPGLGRSLRGGHGDPLQYSCLENPNNRRTCF